MAKVKNSTPNKTKPAPAAKKAAMSKTRKLKSPIYRTFRLQKRIKHPVILPSAFKMFKQAIRLIWQHWKPIGGIVVVFAVLQIIAVKGIGTGIDLQEAKLLLQDEIQKSPSQLYAGVAIFSFLLGSSINSGEPNSGLYQTLIIIIGSLALIWALRQIQAGKKTDIRDAYYNGMYPIIPFVLVLLVIGLQFVPLIIGNVLYAAITNGIAATAIEQILWAMLVFLLAMLTIYMVCSSVFALYIVTLPDMTPMKALRSARQLVLNRRWTVIRKVLFLPFILLVLAIVIVLPAIIYITPLAELVFFVFGVSTLAVVHSYMYTLYRELL